MQTVFVDNGRMIDLFSFFHIFNLSYFIFAL
jgi:hypothetical protein